MGSGFTWLMFAIIFAETGFVVTPFLPGDSLLFALGALAALSGSSLHIGWLAVALVVAAITGNLFNYSLGRFLGPRLFRSSYKILNPKHLQKTEAFYAKHGGKTIILTRFIPIIRTYAPFVAGVGQMRLGLFSFYNAVGGMAWILSFLLAGYFFGNIPSVKTNFHFVILAIIVVSILPAVFEIIRNKDS